MRPSRWQWPSVLTRPASGWSSLLLLVGMLLVVGLAVVDTRPLVLGRAGTTALPLVALVSAGLVGYLLARSRMGVVRAHVLGAVTGVDHPAAGRGRGGRRGGHLPLTDLRLVQEHLALLSAEVQAELRLFLGTDAVPPATLACLVLGGDVLVDRSIQRLQRLPLPTRRPRRRRQRRAACPERGPACHATLDWTACPSCGPLALFALLALLLLVRLQLAAHGWQWARRQIATSAEVDHLFLRAGGLFVVVAIIAATSLAAVARVPAQSIDEGALRGPLEDLRHEVSRWLRLVAVDVTPRESTTLEDRLRVADAWEPGGGVAFAVEVEGSLRGNYWWLSAFADFDGRAWSRTDTTIDEVAALAPLEVPADASGAGPFEVVATVTPRRSTLALGTLIGPSEPWVVSRDVRVRSLGDREGLTEVTFADEVLRGGSYTVTSAVHDYDSGGRLADGIRAASHGHRLPGLDRPLPARGGRRLGTADLATGRRHPTRRRALRARQRL